MSAFDFGAYANQTDFAPQAPAPPPSQSAPMTAPGGPSGAPGGSVLLLPPPAPPPMRQPMQQAFAGPGSSMPASIPAVQRPMAMPRQAARGRAFGDDTPASSSNLLGVALVTVPVAAYLGSRYGGLVGALGGALLGGAALNTLRAITNVMAGTDAGDKEATVSGTYAAIGAAGGGFLLYKGHKDKRPSYQRNTKPLPDEDDDEDESPGDYDIGRLRI